MSQTEKSLYYNALKGAGLEFPKHYREYSTAELKAAYEKLNEEQPGLFPMDLTDLEPEQAEPVVTTQRTPSLVNELPGQRLNTQPEDEPIHTDENGLIWYQVEVRKPAGAKPRGRRVLKYLETGTTTKTVQDGQYIETFEVAGDEQRREAEVKITLPSYQVGIYRDPRLPFKVHVYNEVRGFDFFEVNDYYNGADLVPEDVKRMYVENELCYDIRTVVRAIQNEYRQLQLTGKVQ